jgi:hypothetical protein
MRPRVDHQQAPCIKGALRFHEQTMRVLDAPRAPRA